MTRPSVPATPAGARLRAGWSFSFFGFSVNVRPEFFLVAVLFGAAGSPTLQSLLSWVAVVFASVLFHELGHAVVARSFGCIAAIELVGMGGLTHFGRRDASSPPLSWRADLAISLAGPAFGLGLGLAVWLSSRRFAPLQEREELQTVVRYLLFANVGWSVLNLVPILPYDGGVALRTVLVRLSPTRGPRLSHLTTLAFGAVAIGFAIYLRNPWIAYLVARGVVGSFQALRHESALGRAWARWEAGAYPEAAEAARHAIPLAGPGSPARARAIELVILASLASRDSSEAKRAFDAYPPNVVPSALLRAIMALDGEDRATAASLLSAVPEPLLARVFVPLIEAWTREGASEWRDRAEAWLDPATLAALPERVRARVSALAVVSAAG